MKDRGSWRTYRIVFLLTLGVWFGWLDWIMYRWQCSGIRPSGNTQYVKLSSDS